MSPIKVALVYAVAGSAILYPTLRAFKVSFDFWHPIAACVLAGLCALFLPSFVAGPASLAVMFGTLMYTTGESFSELKYPVLITRLGMVPALILVGTW